MNYKKFRCVLRLSDKDWRIWRLWLTISCLHSSTCESWSPPIYCWRSSSKHCQSSKHSGRVCHGRHFECAIIFKYLRKCKDTYFILQNKYLHIYEDSFGVKILRDDCTLNNYNKSYSWKLAISNQWNILLKEQKEALYLTIN